jgi:hypothetical protein
MTKENSKSFTQLFYTIEILLSSKNEEKIFHASSVDDTTFYCRSDCLPVFA